MAHCFIVVSSMANGLTIPSAPPPPIHIFLNTRNATALQAECTLTYDRHNIYLTTSFCQDLLYGHILEIP